MPMLAEPDGRELAPVDCSADRLRVDVELGRNLLDMEQAFCMESMHE